MSVGSFWSALLTVFPVALVGFLFIHTVIRKVEERVQIVLWYGLARFLLYVVNLLWWSAAGIACYYLSLSA